MEQIVAQAVTEDTELDNPQQLQDTLFSVTPTVIGIQTLITDRTALRISANAWARTGRLAQNSIERKKDEDGLTILGTAGTTVAGAGTTITSGHIRAARYLISSNTTEPAPEGVYTAVFHGFQIKIFEDEILDPSSGALQLQIEAGLAARVFQNGFRGMLGGTNIKEDGNITIDTGVDAQGGVFHKEGIVLVQGRVPYVKTREEPHIGGGATSIYHYDEYAYGERSSGNWLVGVLADAATPSS